MNLAGLSGWRMPHQSPEMVQIAAFTLPGGTHLMTSPGAGESCGWQAFNFGAGGTIDKWANPGGTSASLGQGC